MNLRVLYGVYFCLEKEIWTPVRNGIVDIDFLLDVMMSWLRS